MDISKLTFCELNIDYNRELLCKEVDEQIKPSSILIDATSVSEVEKFSEINDSWGMVPKQDYHKPQSNKAWFVNSLIYCETEEQKLKELSLYGSIVTRNKLLGSGNWVWKKEFENLELTKFVKSLPLTDIIHARILCLYPGRMAAIHRDNRFDTLSKNLLSVEGYVSITLNLSDGGFPLYYSLLSDEHKPLTTNAPLYVFNDYNLHGVPYVTSIRRQVRITGKPTEEFFEKLKLETLITE